MEQTLRRVLATYLDEEPGTLEIERGEQGKPELRDGGGLEFNLSHSGELVAVAVTRGRQVGIDIERIAPRHGRPAAFYRDWVRHEATVKCLGVGLLADPAAARVAVEEIEIAPGYAAAVAVADSEVGRLSYRRLPAG